KRILSAPAIARNRSLGFPRVCRNRHVFKGVTCMKTAIALSVVAAMAMTSGAHAGGFFAKRTNNVLSNITRLVATVGDVVDVGNVTVLNGNTVAVGNNSSILSGILSGNKTANGTSVLNGVLNGSGILGIGGQNQTKKYGW